MNKYKKIFISPKGTMVVWEYATNGERLQQTTITPESIVVELDDGRTVDLFELANVYQLERPVHV